jgi:putative ABC transport system permease protein
MRPATIFYLYRVRLRARLVQELLAVTGIAVGVALLFASQVADTSLSGSVSRLTEGLLGKARLQLTARSPLGFDEHLLGAVRQLPGVLAAVPVLQRSVNLVGPHGSASVDLIGVNATFASLKGQILAHVSVDQLPREAGVALPAPVARQIGVRTLQPVELQVGGHSARTVVALTLQPSDIGDLVNSPLAIASLGLSQRLAGMAGRINRIMVEPSLGADRRVRRELDALADGERLNVTPATFDSNIFKQAEGPTSQSTELFSAISALVGFMFAFNAMLLTVPQRRSLIDDLRLDGYSPLEIIEVMLFDAAALGIAGSAFGLFLGNLLSRGLLQANPGYLSFAFAVGSERVVSWQGVVLACAGGLAAALAGVTLPLARNIFGTTRSWSSGWTSRREPFMFLWQSFVGGLIALSVVTAIVVDGIATLGTAIVAFTSLVVAMLLLLPAVFRVAVKIFDLAQRPIMGAAARIAVIELQSNSTRVRSLAIAATGAIAVFGSVAVEGARQNLENGLGRVARETSHIGDIWISPRGKSNTIATTPFPRALEAKLLALPGVGSVSIYRGGFLDVGDRRTLVIAPPRDSRVLVPFSQVLGDERRGAQTLVRSGGWATLSKGLVERLGLRVGERFTLPTPAPSSFRLAAVTTNLGWPPGAVVVNAEDFSRAWGTVLPNAYIVDVAPGYSASDVQRRIRAALARDHGLTVQTAAQREAAYRSTQRQGLSRLSEIAVLILTAAVLAMAAAMAAMIWQRRPRLAGMKVDGFDQGELWRALLWESAILLGSGCLIGAAFGLYGQVVLTRALASITGFPVIFAVGGAIALAVTAAVTAVAVMIAALPGYLATQVRPALQD